MRIELMSRITRGATVRLLPAILALAAAPTMWAATTPIVFAGLEQAPFGGTSFTSASGVALDAAGNLYVSETNSNWVKKITAGGTPSTLSISGLNNPRGIAIDPSGNLWIANNGANTLTKYSLSAGTSSLVHGFHHPYSIAVDAAGNLYVTNGTDNSVSVLAAGSNTPTTLIPTGTIVTARGVAVDTSGNLFVADMDQTSHAVLEYTAATGALINTFVVAPCQPRDLAVNYDGDLFVGCNNLAPTIYRIPNENGTLTLGDKTKVSSAGLTTTGGVHGLGFGGGTLYATNGFTIVDKIQIDSVDLGTYAIGGTVPTLSNSVTLTFTAMQHNAIGLIPAYAEGIIETDPNGSQDFRTNASGSTCPLTGGNFNKGATCTVQVDFYPWGVGTRRGGVVFYGQNTPNKPIYTLSLSGTGQGSRIGYGLAPLFFYDPIVNGKGFNLPVAVATDAAGNRFVSDALNNRVVKFPISTGPVSTVGQGLSQPFGVAVDGVGNVYIADTAKGILKVPNENGVLNSNHQSVVTKDVFLPSGIRFDKQQNLYVADTFNNRILKIPNEGGTLNGAHQTVIGSGFTQPAGVFPDAFGNVWVVDTGYNNNGNAGRIVKVAPNGTQTVLVIDANQIPLTMDAPMDMVIDAAGDIYITDANNVRVLYISADRSLQTQLYQKASATDIYSGLTMDAAGSLYVTDSGGNLTWIINQPFALNFPNTAVGSTSPTMIVNTSNIGNLVLQIKSITLPHDYQQESVGAPGLPDCIATTIQPGKSCLLAVSFDPTSTGPLDETMMINSTDLNAPAPSFSTDDFPLSGTGTPAPAAQPTRRNANLGTLLPDAHVALSTSAVNFAPGVTTTTVTVTNSTGLTSALMVTAPIGYEVTPDCPTELKSGESCTVSVAIHPETPGAHDGYLTTTLVPADGSELHTARVSVTGTGK